MIPRFSPDYTSWIFETFLKSETSKSIEGSINKFFVSDPILFRYGRSGLYLLVKSLLTSTAKKRVVLPSYTCAVVANAVQLAGGECAFVDCDEGSFLASQETLLNAVDDQTCMVIPTHLFGMTLDTERLEAVCAKNGIFVLQDCAHSFFAKNSDGHSVASLGDGALFGMNISKLANGVRAGALVVKNEIHRSKVKELALDALPDDGIVESFWDFCYPRIYALAAAAMFSPGLYSAVNWLIKNTAILKSQTDYYDGDSIDIPKDFLKPLGFFERKVLARSLDRLDRRVERRREIAKVYLEVLGEYPGLFEVPPRFQSGWTWSHFPLAIGNKRRDTLRLHLEEKFATEIGIIVDYSVSDLNVYRRLGHQSTPRALAYSKQVINLPLTFTEGFCPRRNWRQFALDIALETAVFLK